MPFRLDHVVILVNNLEQATRDYAELGFTVTPGGEHTDGATHNALVAFADGSYLELIAFKREAPEHRWWRHVAAGEGLIDWALLPSDIASDIAAASVQGIVYTGPVGGGRQRPDGQELRWQTGLPPSTDLPFFCADVTPRSLRVPQGEAQAHANGATGIAALVVAVADVAASSARYEVLLGAPLKGSARGLWAGPSLAFALGETRLVLVGPSDEAIQTRLADHGEGLVALVLRSQSESRPLNASLTHGVPLELVLNE